MEPEQISPHTIEDGDAEGRRVNVVDPMKAQGRAYESSFQEVGGWELA